MIELLTQSEYAERVGVSRQYIQKLVKSGKIMLVDGRVDVSQADSSIESTRQPHQPSKVSESLTSIHKGDVDIDGMSVEELMRLRSELSGENPAESSKPEQLLSARVHHYQQKARIAQMEADKKEGLLVSAEAAERTWFTTARQTRDKLMSIPDRKAAEFAGMKNEHEIHKDLSNEIRIALADVVKGIQEEIKQE